MSEPVPDRATNRGKKRKGSADTASKPPSKRAIKRLKRGGGIVRDDVDEIDEEQEVNLAFARMDGPMTVDFLARQTKRFDKDLSIVELEDKRIPVSAVADTTVWTGSRTLDELPSFLERVCMLSREDLQSAAKANGSPHTIVVTAAGLRAADITRTLRVYQTKKATVMKMFAKHIKLQEAIESASKTRINIGVGTPRRLLDMATDGCLALNCVRRVVVDASHVNQKKRGVLDAMETIKPLMEFLTLRTLKQAYEVGEVQVVFF